MASILHHITDIDKTSGPCISDLTLLNDAFKEDVNSYRETGNGVTGLGLWHEVDDSWKAMLYGIPLTSLHTVMCIQSNLLSLL